MTLYRSQVLDGSDSMMEPSEELAPEPFDPQDWASIRAQFRLSPHLAHLSNFYIASNPTPVRQALGRYRRAFDEDPHGTLDDNMFGSEENKLWRRVAAAAADYVGGNLDEIALTSSTTMGLALIHNGLTLKPGQEILTTTHEFYPHYEAIRLACEKSGASMRQLALYESSFDFSPDEALGRIRAAVRPETRVFAIAWVHSGVGVRVPMSQIASVISEINRGRDEEDRVLLVVDGVHGFGVVDEDVAAIGCDFFSAGTHKWILGPRGTGIVWAKPESWALISPTIPSLMVGEPAAAWRANRPPVGPTTGPWVSPGGFFAFEHQWATAEAFEFCQTIGRRRIQDRIAELNSQIKEGLVGMEHVTLHTPLDPHLSAGIVCFDVDRYTPRQVVDILRERRVIASVTPYGQPHVRLSAGIPNVSEDVDLALTVIRSLA